MTKITAAITGVQGYVPEDILSNADLAKLVNTTDEWITSRTGIKQRHILKGEGKGSSVMAIEAVKGLLAKTNTAPLVATGKMADAGLVILVSASPVTAPLVLTNGYISQPEQTEVAAGGKAVYSFKIANAGDYIIIGLVNAPDETVRHNRLTLLHNLLTEFSGIADFSEIVTETK